ncbi:MAG: hypothetical protein KGL95_09440, partial [Patescibacteria group bacterium]|nr:hypothetical protein [Patescibacteria group bacterium]
HLGIPSIVICGEKFELETANALQKKGFGINLGFGATVSKKKIALSTKHLLSDYALRKNMNHVGTKLIDGKGSERISEFITKLVDKK